MKLASLLKPLRCSRVVSIAFMLAATTSGADASMSCNRAAEYYPISDPVVTRRIEERLQAIPAMKNHQIRRIDGQFAIAWQDEDECRKRFGCHHLLLDIRNNEARIVFAYRGTGTIWAMASPPPERPDELGEHQYTLGAFETDDFNYVKVRLPLRLGPVLVGAISSDDKMIKTCARRKYE